MTDHINLGVTLLMNEQFFQSMPEEYQQVILDVMREIADEQQQNTVSQQEGAVEQLKAEGVTVIEIDKEACQEACMTLGTNMPQKLRTVRYHRCDSCGRVILTMTQVRRQAFAVSPEYAEEIRRSLFVGENWENF